MDDTLESERARRASVRTWRNGSVAFLREGTLDCTATGAALEGRPAPSARRSLGPPITDSFFEQLDEQLGATGLEWITP